jgi:hypothetical protein
MKSFDVSVAAPKEIPMFEAEVEMERRSSVLPLLLMACLIAAIVGVAGYIWREARAQTPITAQQASEIAAAALQGPGPAVIHFRTGLLKSSSDDKTGDPNYRLLEKAGILKLAKSARGSVLVSLTPQGERILASVPSLKKSKEADGTISYQAPLAERQFVGVAGINMAGVSSATVDYNWKWVPNRLGDIFDAGGPLVKSFNLWERQTLINKYEADFYSAGANRSTLTVARNDHGWKIAQ